jgi:hypothetical protein
VKTVEATQRQVLEHFVRETLGCKCPDQVFECMDLAPVADAKGGLQFLRLVVGDRLLIYVAGPGSGEETAMRVRDLARRGIRERNQSGYNRFRLVIVGPAGREGAAQVADAFDLAVGADDRAHLHPLEAGSLPGVLGQALSPASQI